MVAQRLRPPREYPRRRRPAGRHPGNLPLLPGGRGGDPARANGRQRNPPHARSGGDRTAGAAYFLGDPARSRLLQPRPRRVVLFALLQRALNEGAGTLGKAQQASHPPPPSGPIPPSGIPSSKGARQSSPAISPCTPASSPPAIASSPSIARPARTPPKPSPPPASTTSSPASISASSPAPSRTPAASPTKSGGRSSSAWPSPSWAKRSSAFRPRREKNLRRSCRPPRLPPPARSPRMTPASQSLVFTHTALSLAMSAAFVLLIAWLCWIAWTRSGFRRVHRSARSPAPPPRHRHRRHPQPARVARNLQTRHQARTRHPPRHLPLDGHPRHAGPAR